MWNLTQVVDNNMSNALVRRQTSKTSLSSFSFRLQVIAY